MFEKTRLASKDIALFLINPLDFERFLAYAIDMNPKIDSTKFGSITIEGTKYAHDVLIRLDGKVKKRKKKLSKAIFGTSHILSLDEAKYIYEDGAELIIIGSGQSGMLRLSEEAEQYFREKQINVVILPTPKAIQEWNKGKKAAIAVFHVTC